MTVIGLVKHWLLWFSITLNTVSKLDILTVSLSNKGQYWLSFGARFKETYNLTVSGIFSTVVTISEVWYLRKHLCLNWKRRFRHLSFSNMATVLVTAPVSGQYPTIATFKRRGLIWLFFKRIHHMVIWIYSRNVMAEG